MTTWTEFADISQDVAGVAHDLLTRSGTGEGWLATVREGEPPRIHPVNVGIVDGHLLVYVQEASAKNTHLAADGRYALASHQDPAVPHELLIRGRAVIVDDPNLRSRAAEEWAFTPDETYVLYELMVESFLLGERESPDEWPPRYRSWKS